MSLSFTEWMPIGPAPIASGQTPGGLSVSGRIYSLAADPTNPASLYAATGGGGVWGSEDGGASWSPLTDDQPTLFTGAIAVAPSNPNVIYVGTGNPTVATYSYTGRGVLKSIDGGNTWTLVGSASLNRRTISQIVVSPTDPNTIYAAVSQPGANGNASATTGIFKSSDGGVTWSNTTASISTESAFTDLAIDPTNPNTLYCAVGTFFGSPANGVYKTTNGGATWSPAGNFTMGITNGWIRLAIAPSSPDVLYAAVAGSNVIGSSSLGSLHRMYRTSDGGTTWTPLPNTPNFLGDVGYFASALAVSPVDPGVVYAAGGAGADSVIRSIDGGQSWSDISTGAGGTGPHKYHHGLLVDPSGSVFNANDGGVFRFDPMSNTWSSLNATLSITQLNAIALDPSNPDIAWAGAQDNGTIKYTGSLSWSQRRPNNGGVVRVDFASPNTVYHEYDYFTGSGFIQRSTDGGGGWSNKTSGINLSDDANFYPPLVVDPGNPNRLAVGTNRVYVTTNRGDTWSPISTVNSNGWTTAEPIDALAIARSSPGTIYAAAGGNVFVTMNSGSTWSQRNPVASPSTQLDFTDIIIDPGNAQTAYVVAANFSDVTGGAHVWRTTDGGATWTNVSAGLPDLPTWAIELDPTGPGTADDVLYVGTDAGVYRSTNGGASWLKFGTGLPNAQVRDLELNLDLGILAAGTYGRGMWQIGIPAQVIAQRFDNDFAQHKLVFQFDRDVQAELSSDDLRVTNLDTASQETAQLLSYDAQSDRAVFIFPARAGGTLPEGRYVAELSGVVAGVSLAFHHFAGDANNDGSVNSVDFNILAANFNRAGSRWSHADFNYDGVTNALDFNVIATRFGQQLAETFPVQPVSRLQAAQVRTDLFSNRPVSSDATERDDVFLPLSQAEALR